MKKFKQTGECIAQNNRQEWSGSQLKNHKFKTGHNKHDRHLTQSNIKTSIMHWQ